MIILGVETSCDETSAAVYRDEGLASNIIASQTIHKQYGGVVPELASRAHIRLIVPIVKKALSDAGITLSQIDAIAVTYGPGLVGAILVGLNFAKSLAYSINKPLIGVNHIEGHIFANFIESPDLKAPFIVLIISGGHTQLVYVEKLGQYSTLGGTRDDAAGEAFDKVAKMMSLGYPGGPIIDHLAQAGNDNAIHFPRAMMSDDNFDFSFSGLKTSVLYHIKKLSPGELESNKNDIVASFQAALVDVLVDKAIKAAKKLKVNNIVLAGGVACNSRIRKEMKQSAEQNGMKLYFPSPILCTDNAAMVAATGYFKYQQRDFSGFDLSPKPSLKL